MEITHYSNSFISIRSQGEHIVCDPWVGKANNGGWQSFPEYSVDQLASHLSDARWVYISHLHDDHLNPNTLKALNLLDREFFIKRFEAPILRERLKRLGVKRIHEIDSFTVNKFGPFDIAIFPQMTSNTSGLKEDVNFDLDTSIAFKADGVVFFNQVDNPLSLEDITKIQGWLTTNLGEVNIACLKCGAASEYPQLFLNIDQIKEKKKIVSNALESLGIYLELLKPNYYFPAGGTYLIPGWMSIFNKNIAQPIFSEISELVSNLNFKVQLLNLEGGYSIDLFSDKMDSDIKSSLIPIVSDLKSAVSLHGSDPYEYEDIHVPSLSHLQEILDLARINWQTKIRLDNLNITQSISLKIYNELSLDGDKPNIQNLIKNYKIFESTGNDLGDLVIHIDQRALYGCLTRKFVWNGVLGSLCLYDRNPNNYYPTDFFSINYLTLNKQQIDSLNNA